MIIDNSSIREVEGSRKTTRSKGSRPIPKVDCGSVSAFPRLTRIHFLFGQEDQTADVNLPHTLVCLQYLRLQSQMVRPPHMKADLGARRNQNSTPRDRMIVDKTQRAWINGSPPSPATQTQTASHEAVDSIGKTHDLEGSNKGSRQAYCLAERLVARSPFFREWSSVLR
jgi:hypothetical protein